MSICPEAYHRLLYPYLDDDKLEVAPGPDQSHPMANPQNVNPPSWSQSFLQGPSNDLVLQSSDGVQFAVHKLILSVASPIFKDMFEVAHQPQPAVPVPLTEESVVLERLLKFIYHRENPPFKTLDDVLPALRAAHKYQVESAVRMIVFYIIKPPAFSRQMTLLRSDPLRVYAVARRLELRDLEHPAREEWFNEDLLRVSYRSSSDVDEMPHGWYRDLLLARKRRRAWFILQEWDMHSYTYYYSDDDDELDGPGETELKVRDPYDIGKMRREILNYPCLKRIHTIMENIHTYFEKTAILGALDLLHKLAANYVEAFPEAKAPTSYMGG